ncbi:MAG: hypothetical protein SGJ05_00485 [bacterium]|nr:hypothetical protein [bacterium]
MPILIVLILLLQLAMASVLSGQVPVQLIQTTRSPILMYQTNVGLTAFDWRMAGRWTL